MHPQLSFEQKTLAGLEWPRLWAALVQRTRTVLGERAAQGGPFLPHAAAAQESLRRIAEMCVLQQERGELSFDGVGDLEPLLQRAEKGGGLDLPELCAVLGTQRAGDSLAKALAAYPHAPLLGMWADSWRPEQALCATLGAAITPDGELSEAAYPALGTLRREVARRREEIYHRLEAMLRSRSLANALQEKIHTLRGGRYVVPVKLDFRGQVPGIMHDVSASGATLYIEPHSVVEAGNALTLAARQREALVVRILADLSAQVGQSATPLRENLAWLGGVDLLHAQGLLAAAYGGHAPQVGEQGRIALVGVANPLMLLDGAPAVRNDLALGGAPQCLVLSGANTGGKTVLLKAVGLCALLVRAGMPLPAGAGSRFDFFADVRADIGDQQDLAHSLSTFSAQIRFMAETVAAATPASLILVDEILTGTAPQEGAALAATLLETLVERGAVCMVTTHYGELKELAAAHPAMANGSVSFDSEKLVPTYHLLPTTPGASYAFPIARRYGLPDPLVAKAEQTLAGRPAQAEALLTEARATEQRLRAREEALAQREAELDARGQRLGQQEQALSGREWQVKKGERGRLSAEFDQARREIAAVIEELRGAKTLPSAGQASDQLARLRRATVEKAPAPAPGLRPADLNRLLPGDGVYLPSMGQSATLERVLARGRRARVMLGALPMEVDARELALPPEGGVPADALAKKPSIPKTKARPRQEGGAIGPVLPTTENTLDLRGFRLEEALEMSERFFDQCLMKYVNPVVLIHGHGTGKLKGGLRKSLPDSSYVAGFRPGEEGEGRDGVTVVALNL